MKKPFGHTGRIVIESRNPVRGPLEDPLVYRTVRIRRRGPRSNLERAARKMRGFLRWEGEIEALSAREWVNMFGQENERGTSYGRVIVEKDD